MNEPRHKAANRSGLLESVLEVLPEMVLIHDDDTILFANSACRRLLAADSPADLEGRAIDELVHPDAREAGRERRRLLIEGGRSFTSVPIKLVALDGKPRHVVADAHPIAFDDVKAAMVLVHPQGA